MDIFQSILLGIIQGVSEFLPISSSGHLVVAPWLFNFKDPGLSFDVALHFGTLLAVVAYFWRDWKYLISSNFQILTRLPDGRVSEQFSNFNFQNPNKLRANALWILAAATVPGVLAGLFLDELAATVFRHPLLVAFNLFFWGVILYWADKRVESSKKCVGSKKNNDDRRLKDIKFTDGILIGLAQALAIVPGTSRSGITITAGLFRKLDRVSAARFSFLMLTPIVLGASILQLRSLASQWDFIMGLGIIFSAVSGYLAIKYLIKFVERTSYKIFFWYRFVLAIIIVIVYFL